MLTISEEAPSCFCLFSGFRRLCLPLDSDVMPIPRNTTKNAQEPLRFLCVFRHCYRVETLITTSLHELRVRNGYPPTPSLPRLCTTIHKSVSLILASCPSCFVPAKPELECRWPRRHVTASRRQPSGIVLAGPRVVCLTPHARCYCFAGAPLPPGSAEGHGSHHVPRSAGRHCCRPSLSPLYVRMATTVQSVLSAGLRID